jgi:hypothetical protein
MSSVDKEEYTSYSAEATRLIEEAFIRFRKVGNSQRTALVPVQGNMMKIDFVNMIQFRPNTEQLFVCNSFHPSLCRQRRIRRSTEMLM